jgi:hypothetical protein
VLGSGSKRLLVAAAVSAVLLAAPGASGATPRHSAYAGLGTWFDIYSPGWGTPEREVAAMARDGVKTLYIQTGNYSQSGALVHPRKLGRFIDAAHADGLKIVAWYLPAFTNPAQDLRRSLAAIRFRSAKGERFDSFALDIEASLVSSARLRTERLLQLSAKLRKAVGRRYRLGAIIPSPLGFRHHPNYWPHFPFRRLARDYDVLLPMAYATDAHVRGTKATRAYDLTDMSLIRTKTGDPHVPIHLIGGIANRMGAKETAGFLQAVAAGRPLGYSLYDFPLTSAARWKALTQSG